MIKIWLSVLLSACVSSDPDPDIHGTAACDISWAAHGRPVDVCEEPCAAYHAFEFPTTKQDAGTCAAAHFDVQCHADTEFDWRGISGCCVLYRDGDLTSIAFSECL